MSHPSKGWVLERTSYYEARLVRPAELSDLELRTLIAHYRRLKNDFMLEGNASWVYTECLEIALRRYDHEILSSTVGGEHG